MIRLSKDNGKPFELNWTVETEGLLRDFLQQQAISKRALTDIKFAGGFISVNGEEATVRRLLQKGDQVRIVFPLEVPSGGIEPENVELTVLHEDDVLIAVAKPAGMTTIPSREHPRGSLASGLLWLYEQQNVPATAHIVTRLDRDTSGIVLAAKNRHVHHLMSEMQKKKQVFRQYEAFAEGIFAQASGEVEAPIGRRDDSIMKRMVRPDGQYAKTRYQVQAQYADFAHISIKPETGRTHQIRVHMAHIGHPLCGDDMYGGSLEKISRQALHCGSLRFTHPLTNQPIKIRMPLPEDMKAIHVK